MRVFWKIITLIVVLRCSVTLCEDIEAELRKEVETEEDKKIKVILPSSASFKNEDDDIPDADSLPEDAHPSKVRFEDDIILEREKDAKLWKLLHLPGYKDMDKTKISSAQASVRAVVTGPVNTVWPHAIVPFYIDPSRRDDTGKIVEAVRHLEKNTCIKFPRLYKEETGRNYIRIVKGSWASSRLGIYPGHMPQKINLHNGFMVGNLVHEFMHALGFLHEHSRPDRGKYLIMKDRIKKRWNFKRADLRGLDWENMGIPYDYKSITHYSDYSMTPRDPRARSYMGQRKGLTRKDICQLNRMYHCHKKLDEMGICCDCLNSYTERTCTYLKKKGFCIKRDKIMKMICPRTCGVCCQSKCDIDFQKVGCFNTKGMSKEINTKSRGKKTLFFDSKGSCSQKSMKSLDERLCKCAKLAKSKQLNYFTLTQSGHCIATKKHNYKWGESEHCRDTSCQKVQYSNVKCAQGKPGSMFLYKIKE